MVYICFIAVVFQTLRLSLCMQYRQRAQKSSSDDCFPTELLVLDLLETLRFERVHDAYRKKCYGVNFPFIYKFLQR
jgi:hypothetical protein